VDFDAIAEKEKALVFTYGKKLKDNTDKENEIVIAESEVQKQIRYARNGQGKYREAMLEDCMYICPITMINDERLLIASHAKPYAVSTDEEKVDPKNGFILSALMDKLFDRGFITFSDDKHLILSQQITPKNWERMGLRNGQYIQALPLDEQRKKYLDFHRKSVFHGIIESNIHIHIDQYNDNSTTYNIKK
jgi:predicted restriction endonuclease